MVVLGANINHPIRYCGRRLDIVARAVAPLPLEVPNRLDSEHLLTRVPALHVGPVEFRPRSVDSARWLLAPCPRREAGRQDQNRSADSFHEWNLQKTTCLTENREPVRHNLVRLTRVCQLCKELQL